MSMIKEMQKFTAISKYAKWIEEKQRREVWEETAERYIGMMVEKHPSREGRIRAVGELIKSFEVMPSMRGLQFGGKPTLQKNARIFNCTSGFCDRLRFFQESFYLLLCGSGVGFSVQDRHLCTLPKFSKKRMAGVKLPKKKFVVTDDIEGWANTSGVMLSSYHEEPINEFADYHDAEVVFDYSKIRDKGALLSFGIGRAPGPIPLRNANIRNRELLNRCLAEGHEKLNSIYAYDYAMHDSDAVISGGVRRSALIVLFDLWDQLMMTAKTGNWRKENPQRGRSNNSVILLRGQTKYEEFQNIFKSTKEFGEPGFYWVDHPDAGGNPCFRGNTRIATSNGLIRIDELYKQGNVNEVVSDNRVGKGNVVHKATGVSLKPASPVVLTQKNADIFRVETEHGYFVEATANHEFITPNGRVRLENLKAGETLFIQSAEGQFGSYGSLDDGFILGMVTGDGCICGETAFIDIWENDFNESNKILQIVNTYIEDTESFGKKPCGNLGWVDQTPSLTNQIKKKRIGGTSLYRAMTKKIGVTNLRSIKERVPECVFVGSRGFVAGYLRGYFLTDGSVQGVDRGTKGCVEIRLTQSNKKILEDVQVLLANFGLVSRLYLRDEGGMKLLPNGVGVPSEYLCQPRWELVVNRPNLMKLLDTIGLEERQLNDANKRLDARGRDCRKPERYITKVSGIQLVAKEDVYCLNQPETNGLIANGIAVGNCLEVGFHSYLDVPKSSPDLAGLLANYQGPIHDDGDSVRLSGFQGCNLSSINGSKISSEEDFYDKCRAASDIGTWQASFTDFPYLGPVTEKIFRKEALLGVSIAGIMHNPKILLNPDVLSKGAKAVVDQNKFESARIGINQAARTTCVKPDGNLASVLGSFSGVHPGKFREGIRYIQVNKGEPPYKHFRDFNSHACVESMWSENKTDDNIRFPVKYEGIMESDLTALEFLEHVRLVQLNWVKGGKVEELCTRPWISNNVSNTVRVRDHEWQAVADKIFFHQNDYSGVSFIGAYGDRDFPQAPFTTVLSYDQILAEYGSICTSETVNGLIRDAGENLWNMSDTAIFGGKDRWSQHVVDLAKKWFGGNVKKCTYMLKDIYNRRVYDKLMENFVEVDYSKMVEVVSQVQFSETVACGGGACEM